jgi:SAM-dependent methyltransferase
MTGDQRKSWNREYRYRGKLWRGESRERDIIESNLLPGLTLDNGCGNGKGTPAVDGVIGLDFSLFALSLYNNPNRILASMVQLPFKDRIFSNVLFIHSLDHLRRDERRTAMIEASRVLKDGGRIIIRVFSREDFRYGKGKEVEENTFLRGNKITTHYFDKGEFTENPDFQIESINDINYTINIKGTTFKRQEFIIILVKFKSRNIQ